MKRECGDCQLCCKLLPADAIEINPEQAGPPPWTE